MLFFKKCCHVRHVNILQWFFFQICFKRYVLQVCQVSLFYHERHNFYSQLLHYHSAIQKDSEIAQNKSSSSYGFFVSTNSQTIVFVVFSCFQWKLYALCFTAKLVVVKDSLSSDNASLKKLIGQLCWLVIVSLTICLLWNRASLCEVSFYLFFSRNGVRICLAVSHFHGEI